MKQPSGQILTVSWNIHLWRPWTSRKRTRSRQAWGSQPETCHTSISRRHHQVRSLLKSAPEQENLDPKTNQRQKKVLAIQSAEEGAETDAATVLSR
ncbi:hypothetical protein QLQ11_21375 [Ochrobactrum sp. SSR]|uniref:hypothetical protein n=1 Tax=Ochrobactrum sp. SSR TaxID=3045176 RepID=UPI0027A34FAA|nr:hypothetical protein QLQ11_21375 [Ochrobactrum sp. SSR]